MHRRGICHDGSNSAVGDHCATVPISYRCRTSDCAGAELHVEAEAWDKDDARSATARCVSRARGCSGQWSPAPATVNAVAAFSAHPMLLKHLPIGRAFHGGGMDRRFQKAPTRCIYCSDLGSDRFLGEAFASSASNSRAAAGVATFPSRRISLAVSFRP